MEIQNKPFRNGIFHALTAVAAWLLVRAAE